MGRKIKPIQAGTRFGRVEVLSFAGTNNFGQATFLCRCSCGKRKTVTGNNLRRGYTTSCGCLAREGVAERFTTHGMSKSPEYQAYKEARKRCRAPNSKNYASYGGRGIEFRFSSFIEFFAAVGPKNSPSLTLDRIDNDGHYEPGNVRWATRSQNLSNRRPIGEWKAMPGIFKAAA